MTDTIICTPAEFLPILVVIGLVFTMIPTLLKMKAGYNDALKANLRSGGDGLSFGMDYLSANVIVIVSGVVASVLIGGLIYDAIAAPAALSGCVVMAIVASLIIGTKGQEAATILIDIFRDKVKISDLSKKAKE